MILMHMTTGQKSNRVLETKQHEDEGEMGTKYTQQVV
jgi:hypothetical protein